MSAEKSHYKLFKELLALRKNATFINGNFQSDVLGSNVFGYSRTYAGISFIVAINFGDGHEEVDVSGFNVNFNEQSKIHLTSSNSELKVG
jgi:glycosidase